MKAYMLGTTIQVSISRQSWKSASARSARPSRTARAAVTPPSRAFSSATWISSGWLYRATYDSRSAHDR